MLRRTWIAAIAAVMAAIAVGMVVQLTWAAALWPFGTRRLTYMFLGSMTAAIGAAATYVFWIRDRWIQRAITCFARHGQPLGRSQPVA